MTTWANLDGNAREAFQRALSMNVAPSTVLVNNMIDSVIQQLSVRELGILSAMPRRQGQGSQYKGAIRTSNSTLAEWKHDYVLTNLQAATDLTGTYANRTFDYKTLLAAGHVSRRMQASGASYADILAAEMMSVMDDFSAELESGLINGDTTTTDTQPDGFLQILLDDVSSYGQEVQASGSSSVAALTLALVDECIDKVKGAGNRSDLVLVMSPVIRRKFNALVDGFLTVESITDFAGNRVKTYDGIPVITSTGMLDTGSLNGGGSMSSTAGGAAGSVMCLNKRYCWIEELTPTSIMPIARASSQEEVFEVFWDGAAVISNPYGAAFISGLQTT